MCTKRTHSKTLGLIILGWALAAMPVAAQGRICADGEAARVGLGIGTFHCSGGTCRVWDTVIWSAGASSGSGAAVSGSGERGDGWDRTFDFSVQPWLWEIDPEGPSAGKLEDGDQLLMVEGAPVTSAEAGRILGDLEPGVPLSLTVNRKDRMVQVEVVPDWTCREPVLTYGAGSRRTRGSGVTVQSSRAEQEARAFRRGGLGVALQCELCRIEIRASDGTARWTFEEHPMIQAVEEDGPASRAGIRPGDLLTHIDGKSLLTREGASRLNELYEGEEVEVRVEREGASREFRVRITGRGTARVWETSVGAGGWETAAGDRPVGWNTPGGAGWWRVRGGDRQIEWGRWVGGGGAGDRRIVWSAWASAPGAGAWVRR